MGNKSSTPASNDQEMNGSSAGLNPTESQETSRQDDSNRLKLKMASPNSRKAQDPNDGHVKPQFLSYQNPRTRPEPPQVVKPEENKTEFGQPAGDQSESDAGDKSGSDMLLQEADIQAAIDHGDACKVRQMKKIWDGDIAVQDDMIDKYSGLWLQATPFPLFCELGDLAELGPGIPLYYYVVRYLFAVLVLSFIIAGIPCWVSNSSADNIDEWDDDNEDSDDSVLKSSVGNHGKDGQVPFFQGVLHVIVGILIMITYIKMRRYIQNKVYDLDLEVTSPSDYTVMVGGLERDFDATTIRQFFKAHGREDGKSIEILKHNIAYDISEHVDWLRKKFEVESKIALIKAYKSKNLDPPHTWCFISKDDKWDEEVLKEELDNIKETITKYEADKEVGKGKGVQAGKLFLTCTRQIDVRLIDDWWGGDRITRWWNFCRRRCCKKTDIDAVGVTGIDLYARIAPEPSDIRWENLGVKYTDRLWRQFITWLITLSILGVFFGLLFGISYQQGILYDEWVDNPTTGKLWELRFYTMFVSSMIMCVNVSLGQIVRRLTIKERHITQTANNISVSYKLTIAQFLNTAILTLIVNSIGGSNRWFVPGGLAVDAFFIIFFTSMVQPFAYALGPLHMLKIYKQRTIKRQHEAGKKGGTGIRLQKVINDIMEGPPLDMAQRYSNVFKTFVVALMYAPMLPVGLLIAPIGLAFDYLMAKYLLLNRHVRPDRLSADQANAMMQLVPIVVFIYAIMNAIVQSVTESSAYTLALIWVFIMLGLLLLPISSLMRFFGKKDAEFLEKKFEEGSAFDGKYQEEAIHFIEDYDRANPVTEEEGNNAFRQLLEETAKNTNAKKETRTEAQNMLTKLGKNEEQVRKSIDAVNDNNTAQNVHENIFRYAGQGYSSNDINAQHHTSAGQNAAALQSMLALRNLQYTAPANFLSQIIQSSQARPVHNMYGQNVNRQQYNYQTHQINRQQVQYMPNYFYGNRVKQAVNQQPAVQTPSTDYRTIQHASAQTAQSIPSAPSLYQQYPQYDGSGLHLN